MCVKCACGLTWLCLMWLWYWISWIHVRREPTFVRIASLACYVELYDLLNYPCSRASWNSVELIFLNIVFGIWSCVIWPQSTRNTTYSMDFKIIIRILITTVSAKMSYKNRPVQRHSKKLTTLEPEPAVLYINYNIRNWKEKLLLNPHLYNLKFKITI